MISIRRLARAALAGALLLAILGCRREDSPAQKLAQEPAAAPRATATVSAHTLSPMQISVTEVNGDPAVDIDGVRVVLRDAEGAFSSCLDPGGSTGVIALRIPIERDGAAGDIAVRYTTTYGSDDARSCFTRIVAAMRFPHPLGATEVNVTLEVSSRPL